MVDRGATRGDEVPGNRFRLAEPVLLVQDVSSEQARLVVGGTATLETGRGMQRRVVEAFVVREAGTRHEHVPELFERRLGAGASRGARLKRRNLLGKRAVGDSRGRDLARIVRGGRGRRLDRAGDAPAG